MNQLLQHEHRWHHHHVHATHAIHPVLWFRTHPMAPAFLITTALVLLLLAIASLIDTHVDVRTLTNETVKFHFQPFWKSY